MMSGADFINFLSAVVLIGFIVALLFLIALLYRANRLVAKLDNLSATFKSFVADIVPAIVNVGTIATAVQGIMRALYEREKETKSKKK
jgi:peptidoglycan biosynthesis protein MviN/MurJ (putative lipid II flippase)